MNKIKIIYDVVKKMKDKNSIKGTFKADGMKDQEKIFSVNSAFERNNLDGQTKGKTNIETNFDGKKMKLENSIDFQGEGCHGHRDFGKHMHPFHNHHHGEHVGGLKDGLSKITAMLGILSSIKIEEKEDGATILSLESINIPEDIKNGMHEMMKHRHEHNEQTGSNHQHHMCMKEFHDMENADFILVVSINKDSEIDKITIDANGEQKNDQNETHDMKLAVELSLES